MAIQDPKDQTYLDDVVCYKGSWDFPWAERMSKCKICKEKRKSKVVKSLKWLLYFM